MKKTITTALALALAVSAHGAAIHTGLLNYWDFDGNGDDTAGSYAESNSTVDDDAVATGTAGAAVITTGSGGLFGEAADFERDTGVDGAFIVSNSNDVDFANEDISISLWAQFEDGNSGNWQALLAKGEGDNYRISTNRRNPGNDQASTAIGGAGDLNSGFNIQDNANWNHIVVTAPNGGNVNIYVNGALQNTSAGTSTIANVDTSTPDALWIGNNGGATDTNRMWDGLIDDVAQWDRALTPEEISLIYTSGQNGIALGAIIPEPSTGILLGLSGLLLCVRRRK